MCFLARVREPGDCLVLVDCVISCLPKFQNWAPEIMKVQGRIFDRIGTFGDLLAVADSMAEVA